MVLSIVYSSPVWKRSHSRPRARFTAVAATIISTFACGDMPAQPTGGSVSRYGRAAVPIGGRVLDYTTRGGISVASIRFTPPNHVSPTAPPAMTATTDATGPYVLALPPGSYNAEVGGRGAGFVRVTDFGFRGDVFVNGGNCQSRYGVISDLLTGRPLAGARVDAGPLTGTDGWYQWGFCSGVIDFGTQAMQVSHPDYVAATLIIGRGFLGVSRLDVALVRRARPTTF